MGQDGLSDTELVAAARCGDREAFAALLERHRAKLAAACRRELSDSSLADDAINESALTAMLSLSALREPAAFGSWLAGIGANVARRWNRDRWREAWSWEAMVGGRRLPETEDTTADVMALIEAAETAAETEALLASLPAGQRNAVTLVYLRGLSLAEAASVLGTSPGAVKTRLHKARARLRERPTPTRMEDSPMPKGIEVTVVDVRAQAHEPGKPRHYAVVLEDAANGRRMPIWLGPNEAIAIALLHCKVETRRPLTFAFAARMLSVTGTELRAAHIDRLVDDTFYATVELSAAGGGAAIDARPSDAMSLALACGTSITASEDVLDRCATPVAEWDWEHPPREAGVVNEADPYTLDAAAIVAELSGWQQKRV